jgi:Ca2+-binding RTX toxin-like protein
VSAYAFELITASEARSLKAGDTVTFNGPSGRTASVAYQAYDPLVLPAPGVVPGILVTYDGHSVLFSPALAQVSKAGGLIMADGSSLYIGDLGNDRVMTGAGDDGLYGGPGHDTLNGGAGRDLLQGNSGDDALTGGEGADTLFGGQGDDVIYVSSALGGVAGDVGDFAHGNLGDDFIFGGAGADTLLGGQGMDDIQGAEGGDWLSGDLGDDTLMGGLGNDSLQGGAGADRLDGDFGANLIRGGDGDDRLATRGSETSILHGDAGADTLSTSGGGQDMLFGGAGRDRFEFIAGIAPTAGVEADIGDWEAGDQLSFAAVGTLGTAAVLPLSYSEFVAGSYTEALVAANQHIAGPGARYVAAQVGNDVFVFVDVDGPSDGADIAIRLVGRNLSDIGLEAFA